MSARDELAFFAEMIFVLMLIAGAVFYFVVGDNMQFVVNVVNALIPIAAVFSVLLIKLLFSRRESNKRKKENNFDIELYLNYNTKILTDAILFLLPISIFLIAVIFKGSVAADDYWQAGLTFLIFYFWQRHLFKKQ